MLPPIRPRPIIPICMTVSLVVPTVRPPIRRAERVYTRGAEGDGPQDCNDVETLRGEPMTKMTKSKWTLTGAALFFLAASPGRAQVAVAGKAGSLGLGLELTLGISPQLNAR